MESKFTSSFEHLQSIQSVKSISEGKTPLEIKNKLRRLYLHYACLGSRNNTNLLTLPKLSKFLRDMQVLPNLLSREECDIIISSEAKRDKCISFDSFCEIMVKISSMLMEKGNSSYRGLLSMIDTHIFPLYNNLKNQGEVDTFNQSDFDFDTESARILQDSLFVLQEIYKAYFPWEDVSPEDKSALSKKSWASLFSLATEFMITPDILSRTLLLKIWQDLVESNEEIPELSYFNINDKGKAFTLKKFLLFLLRTAVYGKFHQEFNTVRERTEFILSRMERSNGFSNWHSKISKPYSNKLSLSSTQKFSLISTSLSRDLLKTDKFCLDKRGKFSGILESKWNEIEDVFRDYCSCEAASSQKLLSPFQFVKIFEDAGLLDKGSEFCLKRQELEIVYFSLAQRPHSFDDGVLSPKFVVQVAEESGKMNFNQFIKALELISKKLIHDPNDEDELEIFIQSLLKVPRKSQSSLRSKSIKDLIHDLSTEKTLDVWHRTLEVYARVYLNHQNKISSQNFIQFATDFSIYPDLVTKARLSQVYLNLYENDYKELAGQEASERVQGISINQLIDGIAYCCLESKMPIISPNEKLCIALGRMLQSKGPSIVAQKTGHTRRTDMLRSSKLIKQLDTPYLKPQPKLTFDQILGNELNNH